MIICSACGSEASVGQRFCGDCGVALTASCPSCGAELAPGQRFCGECGEAMTDLATSESVTRPVTAERRMVSVLFVDLAGFTAFSESRDPEDVRALITDYFDLAREVVERFGGILDKFIGDAVMAWWGATASEEDDAERAVRAGLEIVDRVGSLGQRIGIVDLAARAGIMTGEASVGPGGNEKGLLLGDLVNSASRLQSVAGPGKVFVGRVTAALVSQAIELEEAGTHRVKGKEEPIVASRAVRVLSERGGRGRTDALEPPFVGRVSELRLLKDALHAAGTDGRARLVSLIGQAGVGKSRLVWEFRKYTDGLVETVFWHEGRSPSYGDGIALWALGEMIRSRAGVQETDDDETTVRLLSEAVAEHVPDPGEQAWIRDRLAALLGVGQAAGERSELFSAARAFFERLSRNGTTVLVFEDLHWADPSLLEFIEELPDWSQNHPIVLVTMARPDLLDRRPDWGSGRRGFTSLYVGPLTEPEMAELIEGTVPGIPIDMTSRIVESAGGMPLFAVEMLRMLISDGRLVTGPDGVSSAAVSELEVPTSVHAVISARLDRLPPEDRDVARDASVLGYSFTVDGLAAVRDEPADKVERRLSDLVRREILELVRDPLSPERGQYRWVQSLLKEVAYGRIGKADRVDLHLRAGRYFRDLDEPELAPVATSHYVAAAELTSERDPAFDEELVASLNRAIDRVRAVHAYEQIIGLVETALPVVPDSAVVELRELAASAAVKIGDYDTADRHVDALADQALSSGNLAWEHRALALRGSVANETRRSELAREALEAHLRRHPDLTSDPYLTRVGVHLARARMLVGDGKRAAELADQSLEGAERFDLIGEVADALITRGVTLVGDRPRQGMALLRGALRLCDEHQLTTIGIRALINIGYGSPDPVESSLSTRRALEEAKRIGDKVHARFAAGNYLGHLAEALDLEEFDRLLDDPILVDQPPADALIVTVSTGSFHLLRGDRDAALDDLSRARELMNEVTDPQALRELDFLEQDLARFDGEFETSFLTFRDRFREAPFAPWLSAYGALCGAALEGREDWIEEVGEMTRTLSRGPITTAMTMWVEAMSLLLAGDIDASVALARAGSTHMESIQFRYMLVTMLTSVARHLPTNHPAREDLVALAQGTASKAGATGLANWVTRMTTSVAH